MAGQSGGQSSGRSGASWKPAVAGADDEDAAAVYIKRFAEVDRINEMDHQMGFGAFSVGPPRVGWMINMTQTYVKDAEWPGGRSAVDYYFLKEDGEYFKATLVASPYFFVKCKMGKEGEVEDALRKKFDKLIESIEKVAKEDLGFPNHLSGIKRDYLKLKFRNINDMDKVKRFLTAVAAKQADYKDGIIPVTESIPASSYGLSHKKSTVGMDGTSSAFSNVVDLREHDVPYSLRVSIDYNICVGLWYTVKVGGAQRTQISVIRDKDVRPDPVILAYDIETSKSPLKFPDSAVDPIMMISYMINGQGFLITNRDIVSQDIEDFEYTPKPDYPGNFVVFNEADEPALLKRFFSHIQQTRPTVMVTYNGDFFDFPYVETRALVHGMDMEAMIGFKKNNQGDYWSTHCLHLDCYRWVKRDSYLPAGSQGLKAVTSAKLGYDPLELDPELMTPLASSDPQTLANYSVSDAVATFYLYMKYVHPFIFSLCNIIPLNPDDVLRKGSGTLCETLLMAEAYRANVIMPNKHAGSKEQFVGGHLVETETYIGGHVEALEAGVFRSDIPYRFKVDPAQLQTLIDDLDRALTFSLKAEGGVNDMSLVENYEEVKAEIKQRLEMLRNNPVRNDQPLIYHLDVAAMYPNIILTNRLQPTAMVDESTCAQCDHNRPGKTCQRNMAWHWRGELYTAKKNEYRMIQAQLESETFPAPKAKEGFSFPRNKVDGPKMIPYHALPDVDQKALLHKRLAEYSQKVYRRVRKTEVVERESIVCQKEHAFYIDTVKAFRDRRYDYKALHKKAKKMLDDATAANDAIKIEDCKKLVVLYDSLQLAHKCILNSFYGYVMRKGARWYSMEMAGIVCATGAAIIQLARQLVERIGRPLELDTDGIWAMLPWDFPQGYTFRLSNGKSHAFDYPCVMLNHLVHDKFTNHQYHTLTDPSSQSYTESAENSIFFEIDGPYRAMIIPSSTEEGKLLKKRYAVFNHNGSLAELKGFEVKRRGELKFLKVFQTQIFKVYLEGTTLAECYERVASVANYWLDILHGRGEALEDHDLVDLISENRSMSKSLEEYGDQKSTSISTARRLAEFLGDAMVKDKGLACKFIISAKPAGIPVAQRAVPLAIFSTDEPVMKHYLRKWLKDPGLTNFDMRSIIDWEYYLERLGSMIQKLIVIPAALQGVSNPVSRVAPPDWLIKQAKGSAGSSAAAVQSRITDMFIAGPKTRDMEDLLKPVVKNVFEETAAEETPSELVVPEPAATELMETDYSSWIAGTKAHWKHLRTHLHDATLPSTVDTGKKKTGHFTRLAESEKDAINRHAWQIISIESGEKMGEYRVWVLFENSLQPRSLRMVIPRTLYLHLSQSIESIFAEEDAEDTSSFINKLQKVYRKLPSGEDAAFLYEYTLPEETFQKHWHQFASLLSMPQLLAVYGEEVPLEFQAVVSLGSCSILRQELRGKRDAQSKFSLDDLNFCTTAHVPYLTRQNIRYVSIVHLHGGDSRQMVLLGIPSADGGPMRYRLLVVETGMRRQLPTNLKSLLPEEEGLLPEEENSTDGSLRFPVSSDGCTVEADMFADMESVHRTIVRAIQELVDSRQGPVIVLHHSSGQNTRMVQDLAVPVITIKSLPGGNSTFPALDWQRTIGRRLLQMLPSLDGWLQQRLELARYAHIPLGNLDEPGCDGYYNEYGRVADVFYARALQRSGHLLWWSDAARSTANNTGDTDAAVYEVEERPPSQRLAGLLRTVCVDAELSGLTINAIMEHGNIASEDQAVGPSLGVGGQQELTLVNGSQVHGLLPVIKKLLTGWLRDHIQNGQEHAHQLAAQLHVWLQRTSRLHSPSLSLRVRSLINRTLGLLVSRLHSFGCQVIHIDTSHVIVKTSRNEHVAAKALLDWVQRELKKQDVFGWLDFTPRRYWQLLAWMDASNYHGLAFDGDHSGEEDEKSVVAEPVWMMNWTIAEYLPPALQPIFTRLIQEYLYRTKSIPSKASPDTLEGNEAESFKKMSLLPSMDGAADEQDEELLQNQVKEIDSEFAQLMLRVLREAQKFFFSTADLDEASIQARCFPPLLGSRLASTYGTAHTIPRASLLEFVKCCGAVFQLDSERLEQAEHLMKVAYGFLGIKQFGDETVWKMPTPTITLYDVPCSGCFRSSDLDVCRDLSLATPICSACNTPYDLQILETALISQLSRQISQYYAQDLVCKLCPPGKGIKSDTMERFCRYCASGYRFATIQPGTIREQIGIMASLAPLHGMDALSSFLESLPDC